MRNFLPTLRRSGDWMAAPDRRFFERFFDEWGFPEAVRDQQWIPKVDVSETDDHFIVRAEVPGMDKDDINISLSNGLLTIQGEKKQEKKEEKENYRFVESRYGSFSRSFRVPGGVDADKIDANYKDGVLKVTIPKSEEEKSRKIEITG
ncbi:MAG: Hsp20/alpha crystallin family protein [Desulfobacterales bacterium]